MPVGTAEEAGRLGKVVGAVVVPLATVTVRARVEPEIPQTAEDVVTVVLDNTAPAEVLPPTPAGVAVFQPVARLLTSRLPRPLAWS